MALWLQIPLLAHPPGAGTASHSTQQSQQQQQQEGAAEGAAPAAAAAAAAESGSDGQGGVGTAASQAAAPASAVQQEAGGAAAAGKGQRDLREDPWEWWNQLRFLCGHSTRLGAVLELGADLPPPEDLARWRGEPVK
jgi:hypothetical protein